jgi:hypothetical protein
MFLKDVGFMLGKHSSAEESIKRKVHQDFFLRNQSSFLLFLLSPHGDENIVVLVTFPNLLP